MQRDWRDELHASGEQFLECCSFLQTVEEAHGSGEIAAGRTHLGAASIELVQGWGIYQNSRDAPRDDQGLRVLPPESSGRLSACVEKARNNIGLAFRRTVDHVLTGIGTEFNRLEDNFDNAVFRTHIQIISNCAVYGMVQAEKLEKRHSMQTEGTSFITKWPKAQS